MKNKTKTLDCIHCNRPLEFTLAEIACIDIKNVICLFCASKIESKEVK